MTQGAFIVGVKRNTFLSLPSRENDKRVLCLDFS